MIDVKDIFAKNLRRIRNSRGLSQEKFGEIADIQFRSISSFERGIHFISPENFNKICNRLNILPQEFFIMPECAPDDKKYASIERIKELTNSFDEEKLNYALNILEAINKV